MNYPCSLHAGDTIGLIAPCSPVSESALSSCLDAITSLGFHYVVGESVLASRHGYLSGSDELRAMDINDMFANPDVNGIFCMRGGYGSTRLMHLLDYEMIRRNPKVFVGYSDITSFHLAFQSLCNMVTFHGPMVYSNMAKEFDSFTKTSFLHAISMPRRLPFFSPPGHPYEVLVPGKCRGRIIGGCLSLVSPAIGSFYGPDYSGSILFLEDIDESVPRCDKLMHHLKNSGILSSVNGVILGVFKGCNNPSDSSYTIKDFFEEFFLSYDYPVLYNVYSCHEKPMATIPLGAVCTINTASASLYFDYV